MQRGTQLGQVGVCCMARESQEVCPRIGKESGIPQERVQGAFVAVQHRVRAVGGGCTPRDQDVDMIEIPPCLGQGDEASVEMRARRRTAAAENTEEHSVSLPSKSAPFFQFSLKKQGRLIL